MFSWDGSKNRKKNHDSFTPYNKGSNHGILRSLVKSLKEILATEKALKAFNSPPQMTSGGEQRHGQMGEWKKGDKDTVVIKASILMIQQNNPSLKRKIVEQELYTVKEKTFSFVINKMPSTDLVIIKELVSMRQVNMGRFEDPLSWLLDGAFVAFGRGNLGNHDWRRSSYKEKSLNFFIVRFESSYNLLFGRTDMQRMRIMVSNIHATIKFQTPNGVGTVYLSYNAGRVEDTCKKVKESSSKPLKACPKDCYTLSEIDWKVESLLGFRLKCFLDAYKEYHHIQMAEENEEKTAFYTCKGVYCYKRMSCGLKNVGATYQRLVNKAFSKQIRRNLEAYVDDRVIKYRSNEHLLLDIQETFDQLRAIKMKLLMILLLREAEED
uniref:Reverse transcriptase domain-containing protein n=1 Tax=Tanacetum cinerariifolium TaxID=118510 RepID=A0A6L2LX85_TANCI|nr:reverse transcriptase domain-containing protein [Tanacetum cinerariifolium]